MAMAPTAVLAIVFLTLTAATSDEDTRKVSSSSFAPKNITEVLGFLGKKPSEANSNDVVSDEILDDSDSYEDNTEDSGNAVSENGIIRKDADDDNTQLNAIKSVPQDEVLNADMTELGVHNDFGTDQVNKNDPSMGGDGGVKDADAENGELDDAKKENGRNEDATLQEMSMSDWERAPESGAKSEKKLASIASSKKDPWGRHGGWLSRRRGSRSWGSRGRSSRRSWFSRRRGARGGWLRRARRRTVNRRFFSRRRMRSIRQRRILRRGRVWAKRRRAAARQRILSRRRVRSTRLIRHSTIRKIVRRRGIISRKRITRQNFKMRRRLLSRFLTVRKGQVTFNAEGNNNRKSRFYSRKPHVPGGNSGITIGRGYDMGQKSIKEVITDLLQAGVSKLFASMLAKGAGLQGQSATDFLEKNSLNNVEITEQQQKELFKISYARQEAEVKRLTTKYYKTKWSSLHPKIQEMLIDMKFRGDFRPKEKSAAQLALKAAVQQNNVKMFTEVLKSRSYWQKVPLDRFNQRVKFLEQKTR